VAYQSNESGRPEVYVRAFPSGEGKWQVSTDGGVFPHWRADGREIFYMGAQTGGMLMAVDVRTAGPAIELGTPTALFDSGYVNVSHTAGGGGFYQPFAASADGQRFLIPRPVSTGEAFVNPIAVVMNWAEGLGNSRAAGR
jgi:Tol biopolymer transport system component